MFDCAAHDEGTCAWAAVQLGGGAWANASITLHGASVTFTPITPASAHKDSAQTVAGWGLYH